MIFTVGLTKTYEHYLDADPNPRKAVGGSVWQTQKKAQRYLDRTKLSKFSVYAVDADWHVDTVDEGSEYRSLTVAAKLRRTGLKMQQVSYLYVLVRLDLSEDQQAVQAAHAAIEAARHIPLDEEHPHLVLCGIKHLAKLECQLEKLSTLGLPCYPFYESDLDGELTAFSIGPLRGEARCHLSKYKLLRRQ